MGQSSDAGAFYKRDSGRPFDLRLERRLGPALFTAVDDKTGNILWRHRSFLGASLLLADGRFIILDEDGHLLLATATREGLTVTSKAELLSN